MQCTQSSVIPRAFDHSAQAAVAHFLEIGARYALEREPDLIAKRVDVPEHIAELFLDRGAPLLVDKLRAVNGAALAPEFFDFLRGLAGLAGHAERGINGVMADIGIRPFGLTERALEALGRVLGKFHAFTSAGYSRTRKSAGHSSGSPPLGSR